MTALIDTRHLAPGDALTALTEGALALASGTVTAVVGPSANVEGWLLGRYGDAGRAVTDLACIVYRRKAWFRSDLDPFTLRERRTGQYELRLLHTDDDGVVPLLALDLAPVIGTGTWGDLDQGTSNPAASVLEIGRVARGQQVRIEGQWRDLDDVPLAGRHMWEASRLGSVTQLLRAAATDDELQHPTIRYAQDGADRFARLARGERRAIQDDTHTLFAAALSWALHHLATDLIVGLSQGDVVGGFVRSLPGGSEDHFGYLALETWHHGHIAFDYAPGYFATGAVKGYALDGVALRRDLRRAALGALTARREPAADAA